MEKIKIINAVSGNMMSGMNWVLRSQGLTLDEAKRFLEGKELDSFMGHSTSLPSAMLGIEIPQVRRNLELAVGDQAFLVQYKGPRLEEGATTLPENATLEFGLVTRLE